MMARRVAWALVSSLALAAAEPVEPTLPAWDGGGPDAQGETDWIAGALLLTEDSEAEPNAQSTDEPIKEADPTTEEAAEAETPPEVIPEEFWSAYFGERPQSFLVDPQRLLGVVDYRDRLGFLNYHAGDSSIDLFVYVFSGDQEIPGEVREEELVERFFNEGRPAVVVYYFMGAPQRSMLYLSPSLTDAVPAAEQRRAMESSVLQAFRHVEPMGQFEAFLVQMSIRIYWMERLVGGGKPETEEATTPLAEPNGARAEKAAEPDSKQMIINEALRLLPAAAGVCGLLLAGWLAIVWMRSQARYRFPDFDVEPRLGGAHAAGVGAVISFASAAVPPASQRDQVPDYLRRA